MKVLEKLVKEVYIWDNRATEKPIAEGKVVRVELDFLDRIAITLNTGYTIVLSCNRKELEKLKTALANLEVIEKA